MTMTEDTKRTDEEDISAKRSELEAGGGKILAIIPRNYGQCWQLAGAFFAAGIIPKSYGVADDEKKLELRDQQKAVRARLAIGIMAGMEVGLPPVAALKTVAIINGRPTVFGDGLPAIGYSSKKMHQYTETSTGTPFQDDWDFVCSITRQDKTESGEVVFTTKSASFSWAQAKKAGLAGKSGPWTQYPHRMMQMRARAYAFRDCLADVLLGLNVYEDIIDIPKDAKPLDTSFIDDAPPVGLISAAPTPELFTIFSPMGQIPIISVPKAEKYVHTLATMLKDTEGDTNRINLLDANREMLMAVGVNHEDLRPVVDEIFKLGGSNAAQKVAAPEAPSVDTNATVRGPQS